MKRLGAPWASTVRTCQELLQVADGLWAFLECHSIAQIHCSHWDLGILIGVCGGAGR
jgi:hypothetical protein